MNQIDDKSGWKNSHSPSIGTLEALAIEIYNHFPEELHKQAGDLIIEIAEFPDEEIFEDMALETPFDLLGFFEGRGVSERFSVAVDETPNRITLFRRPILDYWAENEETLGDIVAHVLIHEIGRHFGLSDDDMQAIEDSVEARSSSPDPTAQTASYPDDNSSPQSPSSQPGRIASRLLRH